MVEPGFKSVSPDSKSVESGIDTEGFEKNVCGGKMEKSRERYGVWWLYMLRSWGELFG